jgi:hypothetical protein
VSVHGAPPVTHTSPSVADLHAFHADPNPAKNRGVVPDLGCWIFEKSFFPGPGGRGANIGNNPPPPKKKEKKKKKKKKKKRVYRPMSFKGKYMKEEREIVTERKKKEL